MNTIHKAFWTVAVLAALFAFSLIIFPSAGEDISLAESDLNKISFRMGTNPSPLDIPYLVAQEKGFYKEEGLDVSILPGEGSSSTIKLVDTGNNDFGVVFASSALIARSKGAEIVSLVVAQQQHNMRVFYRIDSGINNPSDISGKTLLSSQGGASITDFEIFAKTIGLDTKSIKWIFSESYLQSLDRFTKGEADAITGRDYQHGLRLKNKFKGKYREFNPRDYGVKMYGQVIIANEGLLKENPEMVRGFVKATVRGWEFALENPEESVKIFVEKHPEFVFEEELPKWGIISRSDIRPEEGFGYQSGEVWETMNEDFSSIGAMENKVNVDEIYTNDFLP